MCLKELHNQNGYDPVKVATLIIGKHFILYQLINNMDEVEHDINNYQNRALCYLPKAQADNTDRRF